MRIGSASSPANNMIKSITTKRSLEKWIHFTEVNYINLQFCCYIAMVPCNVSETML